MINARRNITHNLSCPKGSVKICLKQCIITCQAVPPPARSYYVTLLKSLLLSCNVTSLGPQRLSECDPNSMEEGGNGRMVRASEKCTLKTCLSWVKSQLLMLTPSLDLTHVDLRE